MKWKDLSYRVKGTLIGITLGLLGAIVILLNFKLKLLPSIILLPFSFFSVLFVFMGLFGCNFKVDPCYPEEIFGLLINILFFGLIGFILGLVLEKIKLRKKRQNERRKQ
ncbi:MAG: hypothetical protein QW103_00570 [Candidatus Pacearchaeota archaeon]